MHELRNLDKKYLVSKDKEERIVLSYYNEEYKMWVKMRFSKIETNISEQIIEQLSKEYLRQVI